MLGIFGKRNSFCPMKPRGSISSPGACGQLPVFVMTFKLKTFSSVRTFVMSCSLK
jgi:hypothetical protein